MRTDIDREIQKRAVEYGAIFTLDNESRVALLERMPVLESATKEEELKGTGTQTSAFEVNVSQVKVQENLLGDDLAGLNLGPADIAKPTGNVMDLLAGISMQPAAGNTMNFTPNNPTKPTNTMDLLGDLFGSTATKQAPMIPSQSSTQMEFPSLALPAALTCYEKNGLLVTLTPQKESATLLQVMVNFSSAKETISNISFQVAVPKVNDLI